MAYVAPESRIVGAGQLVDHPRKIARNYLRGKFFLDLFIVLPIPQVLYSQPLKCFFEFCQLGDVSFSYIIFHLCVSDNDIIDITSTLRHIHSRI